VDALHPRHILTKKSTYSGGQTTQRMWLTRWIVWQSNYFVSLMSR
jgi:hypothetical protein